MARRAQSRLWARSATRSATRGCGARTCSRCPADCREAASRARAAESAGIATRRITPVAGSLRLHPLHTPRALMALGAAAVQVRRLAARERAALVHANSIRAGLALRGLRGRAPARIVHVRDCLAP